MNIFDLHGKVNDDTEAYIVSIRDQFGDICIQLESDDVGPDVVRRSYEIHPIGVVESRLLTGWCGTLEFSDDHPLLWNHNYQWYDLYFTTLPTSAAELVGVLYETHNSLHEEWRPLASYVNLYSIRKRRSNGLLASGPEPLIRQYAMGVQNLVKTNTVVCRRLPLPRQLKALILGDAFVVCSDVTVTEISLDHNR